MKKIWKKYTVRDRAIQSNLQMHNAIKTAPALFECHLGAFGQQPRASQFYFETATKGHVRSQRGHTQFQARRQSSHFGIVRLYQKKPNKIYPLQKRPVTCDGFETLKLHFSKIFCHQKVETWSHISSEGPLPRHGLRLRILKFS